MRRNCNLELLLVPPPPSGFPNGNYHQPPIERMESLDRNSKEKQNQQLTIFFDGEVNVCAVTELQARAIIMLASQEMWKTARGSAGSEPSSPTEILTSPLCSPPGLSMKRSLQRFLQKRRHRIQAASPYHQ